MADFNKESKSMMFFCYHETSPLNVQLFLKTLVMDISDGQNFAALYFFCKIYIFPLFFTWFSLELDAIWTLQIIFFLQNDKS